MSTAFETASISNVSPMVGLRARIRDEVGALIGAKELRLLSVKKTPERLVAMMSFQNYWCQVGYIKAMFHRENLMVKVITNRFL